jgi:hypothetical protein
MPLTSSAWSAATTSSKSSAPLKVRQKLGDESAYPCRIGTEPGLGYRWLLDDEGTSET